MAHNIRKNADGQDAFIYNNEDGQAWHQLGTPFDGKMKGADVLSVMPFHYYTEPLYLKDGTEIEDKVANIISDTKKCVGVIGSSSVNIQPNELVEFMQDFTDTGDLTFATGGVLGLGERIWFLAHAPNFSFEVIKGDEIKQYLLLTNAYDGTSSVEARNTSVRVVCENTLHEATQGAPAFIKLRKTSNVKSRMAMAAEVMKSYLRQNDSFREVMKILAKHPITDQMINDFEVEMFGDLQQTEGGRGRTILSNKLTKFEELLVTGKGTEIKGVTGTAYGMLQAFTEYQDWHSTIRGTTDRTNSILFGQAAREKTHALDFALELVGVRK